MYKQGVCTKQAGLYEAWAYQLELLASYKKADAVFSNGMKAATDAEMKARLQAKQKQFQARVLRRVKGEEVSPAETEEEERSALGQLRGHGKKGKVGSVRVGQAKLGGPGVLPSKQPLKENNKQQGGGFAIFQDENATGSRGGVSGPGVGGVRLPSAQDRKENEQKAGTWGAVKGSSRMGNVPLKQADQHKPAFTVHQDEGVQQPVAPSPHVGTSKVLSTRKEETAGTVHCPVALFEPADPTKRAMYCKDKVYQGATEFSFEELQASRWKRQEKVRLEKEEMERKRLELLEMEQRMDRKMEEMQRLMALQQNAAVAAPVPVLQPGLPRPNQLTNTSSMNNPSPGLGLRSREDLTPSASCESSLSTSLSLQRKHSMDDTALLMAANPTGARNRSQGRTPSPHGSKAPCWSQPSPTVNTKEAMAEMQQMWCNASVAPDPPAPSPAPAPFAIFSDENAAPSAAVVQPFPIFCDENAPPAGSAAPFPIYSDENAEPPKNSVSAATPFPIFSDENGAQSVPKQPEIVKLRPRLPSKPEVNEAESVVAQEDQENLPPRGYSQPARGVREVGGVLTQAEGVEWMPLQDQERLLDEDERRQEEELGILATDFKSSKSSNMLPKPCIQANQTIALPNEDDFERMAKLSSTPHTGRAFEVSLRLPKLYIVCKKNHSL